VAAVRADAWNTQQLAQFFLESFSMVGQIGVNLRHVAGSEGEVVCENFSEQAKMTE
jgi:hypothetical protein